MSNIHDGPLATYNPLTDRNLAGYFGNTRMRRHLRKAGLINHRGEIISENQYRVNMARKEHKKHVKELLAQAIVHKTLDLERYRQVEIKRKLEEIAKIELVRRVRASRGRKGDEEVLPYLTPRSMSRPQSERPSESSSVPRRPKSAPAPPRNRPSSSRGFVDPYEDMYIENGPYRRLVIYVDDDGRPVSPPPSDRASSKDLRTEGIDTRHLYALDSEALHQYALKLSRSERGRDGATSPYLISQFPVPPKSDRVKSARSPRRSARMSARPEGPAKERRAGVRQSDQIPHSARKDPDTVEGALMLHRQEPAMMHQGEVQTLCEIQMKYHGPNLTLPRDQHDPTQEVAIEQQHCGGNTLPVFRERLQPGKTFSFISRRHRGYPFSLTLYIDGRVDCRISTCCEYKHGVGVRLGGKMGHFSLTGISGATPCYKCKLSCQAPPRSLKLKKTSIKKKKERAPEPQEEVTVDNTPRSPVVPSKQEPEVNGKSDDDNYEDDFEDEGVNVPVPIDIKSARDIEILNQVNKLGKRVILETSEGAPENISAVIEYNDDSDIVLVKKYRPVESIDVEGILMDTLQTPGIPEALEEEDSFCDGEEEDHVNREAEPVEIKPKKKKSNKAASSVSSMSVSSYSRGKGSSSNQTITHSAPEWLDSLSAEERSNRHLIRPKTAWGHSSTSKVRPVKKLRPITSRKEISQNEKYDMEFLRAKFYPPPHNCLDKPALGNRFPTKRKRPEKQRAEAVQFKNRNKLTDHDISLESHPDTLAKTENFIETLIAGVSDPSQSASLEKKACKRSPGLDCETADEVSDIEPDYPITPVTRPIEVNININKKKKPIKKKIGTTGPSKHPSAKEKVVEGPGVSVAYAKHILKHKDSNGKDVKDMVNINIQTPTKPRGRSPPAHRRGSSPKRARSPSPKRVPKLDLTQAKKEIDVKVEDGKAEIEKLLQECLDTFGLKLQEQQRQFAEQLQLAHDQFAEHLNQAQSALTSHGDDIQGNLSTQLQEATEVVAGQLKESQATLNQQLESSQKTLVDQLTESQTILAQQFKESQTTFGELVSSAQTVIADQLKDSQNIFGEQVQDSQKLLSEQLNESQKTLTNQMKDSQDVLTNQLKDSQQAIADQVKESQQMIADQLKQSQETIAEQLKMSQTTFANQLIESQTALSNQLTESQGQLSNQLSTAQQTIADDLTNAQETIAKQVEENQKILSDQLITSQEKIDNQLHDTQAKISDQLVDTQRQIDEHLLETLETIGKQENEARERLKKDSEETHKNIKQQEEIAKMKLQKESEDSQKRLAEQEEATREKLQKEADETRELLQKEGEESRQTLQSEVKENREMLQKEAVEAQEKLQKETDEAQKRFAEQESKAKEEMEKERAETQRRLEEQEKNARDQLLKESEATQKRLAEQEAQAKEQLQKESEETQKRLAEQELKAKEEMKKESEETARKLAAQEASAMASMKKESEETARRLQEQEQKAREELKKESEESARKFAEQEQAAREQLKKESEETQKRLVEQEELTKEALKKESELTAQRLAEQERSARESLMKEGQESAKRLAEQEQKAREEFQKESAESAKRLADQEAKVKLGLKQELDASKTQLTDAMKVAKMDANRNYIKTKPVIAPPKPTRFTSYQEQPEEKVPKKVFTYRMPEVIYMKNDQKMKLVEVPREIIDDDMMYFGNQDDIEAIESGGKLVKEFYTSKRHSKPDYMTDDSGIASGDTSSR